MRKTEFVRARPAGMIPFALGVLVLAAVGLMLGAGVEGETRVWGWAVGFGVVMTAIGVVLFRQPHRLELTVDDVSIAPRFGAPRRYRSVSLNEPAAPWRVALEIAAVIGGLALLAVVNHRESPGQLFFGAIYVNAYWRWRVAARATLVDDQGVPTTVRLDRFPGAADAIAERDDRARWVQPAGASPALHVTRA